MLRAGNESAEQTNDKAEQTATDLAEQAEKRADATPAGNESTKQTNESTEQAATTEPAEQADERAGATPAGNESTEQTNESAEQVALEGAHPVKTTQQKKDYQRRKITNSRTDPSPQRILMQQSAACSTRGNTTSGERINC